MSWVLAYVHGTHRTATVSYRDGSHSHGICRAWRSAPRISRLRSTENPARTSERAARVVPCTDLTDRALKAGRAPQLDRDFIGYEVGYRLDCRRYELFPALATAPTSPPTESRTAGTIAHERELQTHCTHPSWGPSQVTWVFPQRCDGP